MVFTTLNTAALRPAPSASTRIAMVANAGLLRRVRSV